MKKIIMTFIMFFMGISNTLGLTYGGCEYSDISRLKLLVNNINISYNYHEDNGQIYFDVILNNITPGIYIYDAGTGNYYHYKDTDSGELVILNYDIKSGNYKFYSDLDACRGVSIGSKYYSFPSYNQYYNDPICSDIPNFSLCQKWINNTYSYTKFLSLVGEYKSNLSNKKEEQNVIEYESNFIDELVRIYINYYYYFFIGIILICSIIIIVDRKKNRFKL